MDRKWIESQLADMREVMQNLQFQLSGVREYSTDISDMVDYLDAHVNAAPTPDVLAPDVWDNPQTLVVIKFHPNGRTSCECKEDFRADVRHGLVRVIDADTFSEIVCITRHQAVVHYDRMHAANLVGSFTCEPDNTIVYTIMRSV